MIDSGKVSVVVFDLDAMSDVDDLDILPTARSSVDPSGSGRRRRPAGSMRRRATSEKGSKPTMRAGTWLRSRNRTKTDSARRMSEPSPVVTTWAFVATSPRAFSTNPEPWPAPLPPPSLCRPVLMIVTTPGASRR